MLKLFRCGLLVMGKAKSTQLCICSCRNDHFKTREAGPFGCFGWIDRQHVRMNGVA